MIDKGPILDTNQNFIPLITSKNQSINENKKLHANRAIESQGSVVESKHKILKDEVLNWQKMTLNESAEILKNHICYHNEEGCQCSKFKKKRKIIFFV